MKITYEFHYFKILETLSVNTTTIRLWDIENVKFTELFNVRKFKEYDNNFTNFLYLDYPLCIYNITWKKSNVIIYNNINLKNNGNISGLFYYIIDEFYKNEPGLKYNFKKWRVLFRGASLSWKVTARHW